MIFHVHLLDFEWLVPDFELFLVFYLLEFTKRVFAMTYQFLLRHSFVSLLDGSAASRIKCHVIIRVVS